MLLQLAYVSCSVGTFKTGLVPNVSITEALSTPQQVVLTMAPAGILAVT